MTMTEEFILKLLRFEGNISPFIVSIYMQR
jgi:hypothetical protein